VEPSIVLTMVRVVPIVVQVIRQIVAVSHMKSPQEKQSREHRQEIPQMTSS